MMNIEPNDPRLTDYVLGELTDDERQQIEAIIASDESVRASVDAIRETTDLLESELGVEPGPSLSEEQRSAIVEGRAVSPFASDDSGHSAPLVMTPRKRFFSLGAGLSGMAATFLAGLFVASGYNAWQSRETPNPANIMAHGGDTARDDFDDAGSATTEAAPSRRSELGGTTTALAGKDEVEDSEWTEGESTLQDNVRHLKVDDARSQPRPNAVAGRVLDAPAEEADPEALPELREALRMSPPAAEPDVAVELGEQFGFENVTVDADTLTIQPDQTIQLSQQQVDAYYALPSHAQPSDTTFVGAAMATDPALQPTADAGIAVRGRRRAGQPGAGGGGGPEHEGVMFQPWWTQSRTVTADRGFDAGDMIVVEDQLGALSDDIVDELADLQDKFGETLGRDAVQQLTLQMYAQQIRQKLGDEEQPVTEDTLREITNQLNELQAQLKDEEYQSIPHNPFHRVLEQPQSTFSVDVDTGAYSNMRRYITRHGMLPPAESVRIEEMINYFDYDYQAPADTEGDPFTVHVDVAACPWNEDHRLARIALKGYEVPADDRPPTNLVYLLDVSGSMNDENKLPLLKKSFIDMVETLQPDDRVAIVVYAGASGLVLDSVDCFDKQPIIDALSNLSAGGSTNGGAGIELAYKVATDNFIEGGSNRVILATDGDFNVGVTKDAGLFNLIEEKAKTGVFLSVLGYGMGNLKDGMLEQLADKGNGNYAYIDTYAESRKVLVDEISSTLVTIAKDVKLQVEFNPATVEGYRLIGYENRVMAARDFNDDTKDAGEIGAGHTVTALYEIIPAGEFVPPAVNELKYQRPVYTEAATDSGELFTVNLRYKRPDEDISNLIEVAPLRESEMETMSEDFAFASAVAAFGMVLRDSPHMGATTFDLIEELANQGLGTDDHGYRSEFLNLVQRAREMKQ